MNLLVTATAKPPHAPRDGDPNGHWRRAVVVAVLWVTGTVSGCAFLNLNGCSKLKTCGDLAVYACADSLVCADIDGNTVRSELTSPQRNYCNVCQTE